jgi:hypothetical protein
MPKRKGDSSISTPDKARISRFFQAYGGEKERGAASKTTRNFGLNNTYGPRQVKAYDREGSDGEAKRRYIGKSSKFAPQIGKVFQWRSAFHGFPGSGQRSAHQSTMS